MEPTDKEKEVMTREAFELAAKMGECHLCGNYTRNLVREPNIGEDILVCDDCKGKFEQCSICEEFYYRQEVENGKCNNCR